MRYEHIFRAVYEQPWLVTPAGWDTIHMLLQRHMGDQELPSLLETPQQAGTDFFGDPIAEFEIVDRVAVVPIRGTMIHHAGSFEKVCGACSHQDVARDLDKGVDAVERGRADAIALSINSPGGMAVGTPELARKVAGIQEAGIRIEAFTDELMASAAYYVAAGCTAVFSTRSAFVGSIGTMIAILDRSEQYKAAGLNMKLFASGSIKGAGTPGVPLTEAQQAHYQALVNALSGPFFRHVDGYRGTDSQSFEGGVFVGEQAADKGLVDGFAESFTEFLEGIRTRAKS